ncbi:MAG TPA: YceH family protein [Terriglobia bacterium]|nr:YceH family protein [Terriglobia bacterium]
MDHTLTDAEVRVLGSLIEKEITTPDYYPLSLNALVAACNQSSNRNPVVRFDEETVVHAADTLRERKLVHLVSRSESRVNKYRHVLYEAMNMGRPDIAIMCVLMLRGPQTVGEIRTRTNRLYDFTSLEQVETTLGGLMDTTPPLVARLARQTGQKEVRYAHLLSGEIQFTEPEPELDRMGKLEKEVEDLKRQFEEFRKQFE